MLRRWGGLPAQELVQCHVWLPAFATLGMGGPHVAQLWAGNGTQQRHPDLCLA